MTVEHYLVSITLRGHHIHAYVMSDDKSSIFAVLDEMLNFAEQQKLTNVMSGMVLQTTLNEDGWEIVRKIIAHKFPDMGAQQLWQAATNFHRTTFLLPESDPDDKQLMELH